MKKAEREWRSLRASAGWQEGARGAIAKALSGTTGKRARAVQGVLDSWLAVVKREFDNDDWRIGIELLSLVVESFEGFGDDAVAASVYRARVSLGLAMDQVDPRAEPTGRYFEELLSAQGDVGKSHHLDRAWCYGHYVALRRKCYAAFELGALRPAQVANELWEELRGRYGASEHDEIVTMLGQAAHHLTDMLLFRGNERAAENMLKLLTERYSIAPPVGAYADELLKLVELAAARLKGLSSLSFREPRLAFDGQRSDDAVSVTAPWLEMDRQHVDVSSASDDERYTRLVAYARTLSHAQRHHAEAREVLDNYRRFALPFMLYLRSYSGEQVGFISKTARSGGLPSTVWLVELDGAGDHANNEAIIMSSLAKNFDVVAVANSFGMDLDVGINVPTLLVPAADWQSAVGELIRHAAFIVVRVTGETAGVRAELELIRGAGREADTTVVLMSQSEQESLQVAKEVVMQGHGIEVPHVATLRADSPLFDGLTVISEDVLLRPKKPHPRLVDLHQRFTAMQGRPLEERFGIVRQDEAGA